MIEEKDGKHKEKDPGITDYHIIRFNNKYWFRGASMPSKETSKE